MLMRRIPKSGETIPAIGLGTARTFDVGDESMAREPLREVLREYHALGGRVIDSSPMYGNAEQVVGDLAADLNIGGRLFYATKVWTSGQRAGIAQMEQSMRRMRTETIDLMQVHNLVDWRVHLKTLREWQEQGRVRYVGITHYLNSAFDDLADIMATEPLDFVQLPYNIANREAERRLLPLAAERGIAVLVNVPFDGGSLFSAVRGKPLPTWASEFDCGSWAQFFLKFILAHPAVTCPIPATRKRKHLIDNMQAGAGRQPNAQQRGRMVEYFASL
ncbi:MAG: aldo/keto reductase [Pseudomonadota bacterium]|nr:MAG: aldo/keto reductase [Pseudomonadota bacterium]